MVLKMITLMKTIFLSQLIFSRIMTVSLYMVVVLLNLCSPNPDPVCFCKCAVVKLETGLMVLSHRILNQVILSQKPELGNFTLIDPYTGNP